jgi:hypothetical protein
MKTRDAERCGREAVVVCWLWCGVRRPCSHRSTVPGKSFSLEGFHLDGSRMAKPSPAYGTKPVGKQAHRVSLLVRSSWEEGTHPYAQAVFGTGRPHWTQCTVGIAAQ